MSSGIGLVGRTHVRLDDRQGRRTDRFSFFLQASTETSYLAAAIDRYYCNHTDSKSRSHRVQD